MASYVRFGGWVAGVDMFDASAFRLPRAEAATLDPQHRLLLEATAAALQDGCLDTGAQATGIGIPRLMWSEHTQSVSSSSARVAGTIWEGC